jgi:DNA-directed RNA polymerase subunit alpha
VGAYLTARCLHALGRYDESAKAFAKAAHGDDFEIAMCVADARRQAGDLEGALQEVRKHQDSHADHAELHYQKGRCLDEMGEYEAATEAYEWACQIDPAHDRAAFRLAYLCDLRGLDDEAIAYYEKCAQARPTHVNALLNLGVLYEDKGALDRSMAGKALECYQRVLAADPRNARARLYARDAQGSLEMYYDEETRKRSDRAQSLLSTPVSDFELSVRSRNCLTKMDVRCLGDLARLTEEELLASKNFGETSLQEIKDMLHAKGLRLGMAIEEGEAVSDVLVVPSAEQQDALNRPIDELELSIRSRRAVDSLEVASLADLTRLTERQLLECPNFGQTSLNEIKRKLAERGLALRPEAE